MPETCTHLDAIETEEASGDGCIECLQTELAFEIDSDHPSPSHT